MGYLNIGGLDGIAEGLKAIGKGIGLLAESKKSDYAIPPLPAKPRIPESHEEMAQVIWEASRADEGSISATGANVIAKALQAEGFGKISQELPSWPRLVPNADYQGQVWEYEDGHKLYRGMEVPPPGENDVWQQMDPFMFRPTTVSDGEEDDWKPGPGRVLEIPPSPMDRIADALESISKHGIKTVTYNGGDL